MNKNRGFGLLVVVVLISIIMAVVVGFAMIKVEREIKNNDDVKPQLEMTEDNTGDNDQITSQDNLEVSTKVTNGNSLDEIDKDIEDTQIYEEDFSDL